MKRKLSIAGILLILMNLFHGCGGTVSDGENNGIVMISKTEDTSSNALETLSLNTTDIRQELQKKPWRKIEIDISDFYENNLNKPEEKWYPIELNFDEKRVVAYADCQKITADYRIAGKRISFSRLSVSPAIDLPICVESEFADDAVIALLENSFSIESMREKEMLLFSEDFDTTVTLRR